VPAVMTQGLDGSFHYPKPEYLAAICAQVGLSIGSRRDPRKPQSFTAAWASRLRSYVIRARSRIASIFHTSKFVQVSPQRDD
jgi:hypothetical protein